MMFSVDYPMDDNLAGAEFLRGYRMDEASRLKVGSGNAVRLFGERRGPDLDTGGDERILREYAEISAPGQGSDSGFDLGDDRRL